MLFGRFNNCFVLAKKKCFYWAIVMDKIVILAFLVETLSLCF